MAGKRPQGKKKNGLWGAGGAGYSSATDNWQTPPAVFASLDAEFGFDLDACASAANHKCATYFTAKQDGLKQEWDGTVWLNPPYGRHGGGIEAWMAKAFASSRAGATVVCLIPSRTDNAWWHEYVMRAAEVRLVRGRLKFGDGKGSAPFASAIAVFRPGHDGPPTFSAVDGKVLAAGERSQSASRRGRDDATSMNSSRRPSFAACPANGESATTKRRRS